MYAAKRRIHASRLRWLTAIGYIPLPLASLKLYMRYRLLISATIYSILIVAQAGVTHCFVNLGSDHPSIIEAIVKGQNEKNGKFPRIITCPNEV
jgi:hypothetical protein